MKPVAVIVIVIRWPARIFLFLNGLTRLSFARGNVVATVRDLKGQPFFCCFFFLVLHCTRTRVPAGRSLTASSSTLVNFGNARKWVLTVDPITVRGGGGGGVAPPPPPPPGGGGGGPATPRPTRAVLEFTFLARPR